MCNCSSQNGAERILSEFNPKLNKLIGDNVEIMANLRNIERIEIGNVVVLDEVIETQRIILRRLDAIEGRLNRFEGRERFEERFEERDRF